MYPPSTLKGKEVEVIDINTRDMNVEIMDSNPTYVGFLYVVLTSLLLCQ